jgi:hypothetical protein
MAAWYCVRGSNPLLRLERPASPAGRLTQQGGKGESRTRNARRRVSFPTRGARQCPAFPERREWSRTHRPCYGHSGSSGAASPIAVSPRRRPGDSNAERSNPLPRSSSAPHPAGWSPSPRQAVLTVLLSNRTSAWHQDVECRFVLSESHGGLAMTHPRPLVRCTMGTGPLVGQHGHFARPVVPSWGKSAITRLDMAGSGAIAP